jgi:hypothetical protein
MIERVHQELRQRAAADANACFGYFPALTGTAGIDSRLPACRALSRVMPKLDVGGLTYVFNFVRLSLVRQAAQSPFHLDSDAATALTGDTTRLHERRVIRLLLNLSATQARRLRYLDVAPASLSLAVRDGYLHCAEHFPGEWIETAIMAPRKGRRLHGLLFCANQVLHSGRDDAHGHFVAGFGRDEAAGSEY